jgi:hypothetical protein
MPLELTIERIQENLKSNKRDSDGLAIPQLGFSLGIWNGLETTPASLGITCGASSRFIKNSVVLSLPPRPPPAGAESIEVFRILLEKTVIAWDPDDAVATSTELLTRSGGGMPWLVGGWLTYRRGERIESHHEGRK